MAIIPDPPIQLDPTMDEGHKLTFINQNFLSIANFLKTNSFKIIQTGTFSTIALTVTSAANSYASNTSTANYTHGLGYTPAVIAFLAIANTYYPLQFSNNAAGSTTTASWASWNLTSDTNSLQVVAQGLVYNGTVNLPSYTIKYFLLQETAS